MSAHPTDVAAHLSSDAFFTGARGAVLALVAANAGFAVLYVLADLTLFQLVVVYWWETVWIGVFGGLKLITASLFGRPYDTRHVEVSRGAGVLFSVVAVGFFGAKFLAFVTVLGLVILLFSFEPVAAAQVLEVAEEGGAALVAATLLLLAGHGLSFVVNFLFLGEYKAARAWRLVLTPYARCAALLVAIGAAIVAARSIPALASTTGFAVVLIGLKLLGDLALHAGSHRRPGA